MHNTTSYSLIAVMATISYTEMFLGFVCLLFLYRWIRDRNSAFIDWPIARTLPGLVWNVAQLHDHISKCSERTGGTFAFRGPWFCNMDILWTADPMNTNHILSKNCPNYTKGPDFATIFEALGDGIIAADSDSWKFQRKKIHSYLQSTRFHLFLERTIHEKLSNGLFPVLDHICTRDAEVNLDDIFLRFGFDMVCSLFLGCDPKYLSLDLPPVPCDKAIHDVEEAILLRHVVPDKYWKLLKRLQIGPEKRHSEGLKIFDEFVYHCIESKREKSLQTKMEEEPDSDFLTACLMEEEARYNSKFLRDVSTNLVVAGRDTSSVALSWFFWLLATNQSVESKLLREMEENLTHKEYGKHIYSAEELSKLVYLHAALCETLRLYPSVPTNHKCSVLQDTLPSGHHVKENTKIFISFYAMGRMKKIWGDDCCEFKPERWIAEDGGIVHVPSYKFTAFNAGPRTCLGKDMSLVQMKIVATAMILNYSIGLVEGHGPVVPSTSVILHMKHGLKVRVTKRTSV